MARRSVALLGSGVLLVLSVAGATATPDVGERQRADAPEAAVGHDRHPDFDGDGFADLAISVPDKDLLVGDVLISNAGAVHVLYGSPAGLTALRDQLWHQESPGIRDRAEAGDVFGRALATGDFDADGYSDVAIGVVLEDVGGVPDAGAVAVLYGSAVGLRAERNQLWHQGSPDVNDLPEPSDRFGWALTAGDFDGDGRDDLVVGAPYEDRIAGRDGGIVHVLYGTAAGLAASGDQVWHQDKPGVPELMEDGDNLGRALAAGDFDGDGLGDLVITSVYEDYAYQRDGLVHVLYGTGRGLRATGTQVWSQDSPGILDEAFTREQFGQSLAVGDLDGDGRDDLVAGVWFQDFCYICNNGAFNVIYGSGSGLSAVGNQFWHQDSPGVGDTSDPFDRFSHALATGDFDGDGIDDLAASSPREDLFEGTVFQDQGGVNILLGAPGGLSGTGGQFWTQDSAGILDETSERDLFGLSLGAADFDGEGTADLAIGIRYEDSVGVDEGAVAVIYGTIGTGLRAAGNQLWSERSEGIAGEPAPNDHFGWSVSSQGAGSGVPGAARPDYW